MMVMSVSFFNFVWVTFTPFPCLELLPCLLIRMTASEAPRTWPSPSPFSYFFLTAHRTPHSRPSSASDLLSFLHLDGVHQNVAIRLVHRQASLNRVGIVVAVPHCPPRTRPFRPFWSTPCFSPSPASCSWGQRPALEGFQSPCIASAVLLLLRASPSPAVHVANDSSAP